MLWWTIQKLKSSDWEVRAGAARTLGEAGESKAVPGLIRALEDPVGGERQGIIEALGAIGDPAAVKALISILASDAEPLECKAAADALAKIGSPSLDPLIGLLASEDKNRRRWAAYALGRIKDSRAMNPLIERLEDPRSDVRQAVARALGELGNPGAAKPLMKIAAGRDPETRRAAVEALGILGSAESLDVLGSAALDTNEPLQLAAIQALKNIGGLKAGGKVRFALETGKKAVREAAAAALASMRFESDSANDRAAGAVLRGDFAAALREGPAAADALVSALKSRDASHRLKAVCTLGSLRSEQVVPPLLAALDDYDRAVQDAAAAALSGIGTAAVSGLAALLESERASLRRFAANTLQNIGDPGSAAALVESVAASRRAPADDLESRAAADAAAKALITIMSKSAAATPAEALQRIVALAAPALAGWSDVQDLARRELNRRGTGEERS